MSEQTWTALGVIVALLMGGIGAYYMGRTNAREAKRQRLEDVARAVADAVDPYKRQLVELRDTLRVIRETLRDRERRIEQLEDELRTRGQT